MIPIITTKIDTALKIAKKNNIRENSPDFILITPENSIGIEKIREIISAISLKPYQSPKKIVIIKDAQKLTTEAQNAFLKTLEEPPPNTIIILLVENPDQLLPTILSRCEVLPIKNEVSKKNIIFPDNNLIKIKNLPIGLRFKLAAEIATNRDSAQTWLKTAIISLHGNVIDNSKTISRFQEALIKLSQNVNPRLVLENLLLDFS